MEKKQEKLRKINDVATLDAMLESFRDVTETSSYCEQYERYIQREIESEKADEEAMKTMLSGAKSAEEVIDQTCILNLQKEVEGYKKQLQAIKDNADQLTFQAMAENEAYKREMAEKEAEIKQFYASECKTMKEELRSSKEKYHKIEQEITDSAALEIAKKKIAFNEMKNSLQKQISEKNNDISKANTEYKDLKKQLEDLKVKQNQQKFRQNSMRFEPHASVQINLNLPHPGHCYNSATAFSPNDYIQQDEPHSSSSAVKPNTAEDITLTSLRKQSGLKPNPCSFAIKPEVKEEVSSIKEPHPNEPMEIEDFETFNTAISESNYNGSGGKPRKMPKIYRAQKRNFTFYK